MNSKSKLLYTYEAGGFYIPERMMGGLERYIKEGISGGSFLYAVLTNDLKEAVRSADDENIRNLPAYVHYLYNNAPSVCWGSKAAVEGWVKHRNRKRGIPSGT